MAFDVVLSYGFCQINKFKFFLYLAIHFCFTQKAESKHHKNILPFAQPACFDMYFSMKTVIVVLHHGDNALYFLLYLYQLCTFNNKKAPLGNVNISVDVLCGLLYKKNISG